MAYKFNLIPFYLLMQKSIPEKIINRSFLIVYFDLRIFIVINMK